MTTAHQSSLIVVIPFIVTRAQTHSANLAQKFTALRVGPLVLFDETQRCVTSVIVRSSIHIHLEHSGASPVRHFCGIFSCDNIDLEEKTENVELTRPRCLVNRLPPVSIGLTEFSRLRRDSSRRRQRLDSLYLACDVLHVPDCRCAVQKIRSGL